MCKFTECYRCFWFLQKSGYKCVRKPTLRTDSIQELVWDFYERCNSIKSVRSVDSMEKIYAYARVSSSGQNLDRQIEALLDYGIEERNIIVDKSSGRDFERTGYQLLKQSLLRSGDTLVVKELDRLGRNKQMIKEELEWFKANKIRIRILNIPTTLVDCKDESWVMDMISNILIEVMASIAEEERLKIHQRQKEGIEVAKQKGVKFGRPVAKKPANYESVMQRVASGEITAVAAMKELGVKKTTYYKLKKIYSIEG